MGEPSQASRAQALSKSHEPEPHKFSEHRDDFKEEIVTQPERKDPSHQNQEGQIINEKQNPEAPSDYIQLQKKPRKGFRKSEMNDGADPVTPEKRLTQVDLPQPLNRIPTNDLEKSIMTRPEQNIDNRIQEIEDNNKKRDTRTYLFLNKRKTKKDEELNTNGNLKRKMSYVDISQPLANNKSKYPESSPVKMAEASKASSHPELHETSPQEIVDINEKIMTRPEQNIDHRIKKNEVNNKKRDTRTCLFLNKRKTKKDEELNKNGNIERKMSYVDSSQPLANNKSKYPQSSAVEMAEASKPTSSQEPHEPSPQEIVDINEKIMTRPEQNIDNRIQEIEVNNKKRDTRTYLFLNKRKIKKDEELNKNENLKRKMSYVDISEPLANNKSKYPESSPVEMAEASKATSHQELHEPPPQQIVDINKKDMTPVSMESKNEMQQTIRGDAANKSSIVYLKTEATPLVERENSSREPEISTPIEVDALLLYRNSPKTRSSNIIGQIKKQNENAVPRRSCNNDTEVKCNERRKSILDKQTKEDGVQTEDMMSERETTLEKSQQKELSLMTENAELNVQSRRIIEENVNIDQPDSDPHFDLNNLEIKPKEGFQDSLENEAVSRTLLEQTVAQADTSRSSNVVPNKSADEASEESSQRVPLDVQDVKENVTMPTGDRSELGPAELCSNPNETSGLESEEIHREADRVSQPTASVDNNDNIRRTASNGKSLVNTPTDAVMSAVELIEMSREAGGNTGQSDKPLSIHGSPAYSLEGKTPVAELTMTDLYEMGTSPESDVAESDKAKVHDSHITPDRKNDKTTELSPRPITTGLAVSKEVHDGYPLEAKKSYMSIEVRAVISPTRESPVKKCKLSTSESVEIRNWYL